MRELSRRKTTAVVLLLVATLTAPLAAQVEHWEEIRIPPLRAMKIEQPKKIVLGNGMTIFLMEDRELPLIRGSAIVRGGSRDEPAARVGLADVYGEVWRTGGTKSKTGDELDDFLEARAARVETGSGIDSTTIGFDTLKSDFGEVWTIFVDLLRNPAFRPEKIVLARNQLETVIARRNDDPLEIAGRESIKLVYGPASPYARTIEYATVAAITRDDLAAWHQRHVHPNNIILGIVGDFDTRSMERTIRGAFERWPKGPSIPRADDAITPAEPGMYFVAKDDVTQSNIRIVHLGTTRNNPDYWALEVMNELFGGGSASRLYGNIRSRKGLAYSVGGGVGSSYDRPGAFRVVMGTRSGSTAAAIDALLEEIDRLQRDPITPAELKRAKETILNSYIFRFDRREKILNQQMLLAFYGYPPDFIERYAKEVEKVTAEDVSRVAKKYIDRNRAAILVVGRAADFDRPLSTLGPVRTIDITIPERNPSLE
ncbi:MAG TPA: pitrilysin family protein [Thermoanaerobaculia bacterium]|nr:pitrilysin family protein [Thermoanaerobaculia bacterium]